ncbi:hypothetical protein ACWFMI_18790 [Nocardiopsis terrae]
MIETAVEGARRTYVRPAAAYDPALAWEQYHPTADEERENGRIRGFQRQGGALAPSNGHRGSPASWVCVVLAVAGFSLGGLAIALGGAPPLLILGGVLLVAALAVAVFCDILGDVVLDPPRYESEEPHQTPLHRIKRGRKA